MMNKCDIIMDLLPMYVEELTSESSNQLIEEHIDNCENCKEYLRHINKDLSTEEIIYEPEDREDEELVKDIKQRLKNRTFIMALIGLLVGLVITMQIFPWALVGIVAFLVFLGVIVYLMY